MAGDAATSGAQPPSRARRPRGALQATGLLRLLASRVTPAFRAARRIRGLVVHVLLAGFTLVTGACGLPRWPVQGIVTSPYGLRLVGWSPEVHRGADIAVPDGTPVLAMSGGTVLFAGVQNGYGLLVVLRHHGSTRTLYGHLSEVRVHVGDRVHGGDVIALSGHSGNARGPHLHFEVQRWGAAEDPVPLLGGLPPAKP